MQKPEPHQLSKSTFLRGVKCSKSLYLNKYHKGLRDEIDSQQQAIFDQGTNVGVLAQQLFPGGMDCTPESYYDFQEAVVKTAEEIAKGTKVIYEAAFQFNGVLAALDILVKEPDGWKAYEVKSSTEVSETYELDATIQWYAITNSGIDLKDISIVHINNKYTKNGPLDINELFTIVSVKDRVLELLPGIPNQVTQMKSVLKLDDIPEVEIGPHCTSPYDCDFMGHCWKHVPEYSVFNIRYPRGIQWELYEQGILTTQEIPDDYPLNERHQIQVSGDKFGHSIIETDHIKAFLEGLNYPIYHLDFETFATAVPVYDNSRPYQQLVFQYSIHKQNEINGNPIHFEFLSDPNKGDQREQLIQQMLVDCGEKGDILVYNIGFEKGKIKELAEQFPKYSIALLKLVDRLKDLMFPFQQRWYYTPEMRGSYSIKKVLPALVPELSYKDLEIQEGGTASNTFSQMVTESFDGDIEQTREALLKYCELDTYAMVKILDKLYEL